MPSKSIAWIVRTVKGKANLRTSAAPLVEAQILLWRTASGQRRFYQKRKDLSAVEPEPGKSWEVVQVVDMITPGNPHYSEASRLAKTAEGRQHVGSAGDESSWRMVTSHDPLRMSFVLDHELLGCHLPCAPMPSPMLHNEDWIRAITLPTI